MMKGHVGHVRKSNDISFGSEFLLIDDQVLVPVIQAHLQKFGTGIPDINKVIQGALLQGNYGGRFEFALLGNGGFLYNRKAVLGHQLLNAVGLLLNKGIVAGLKVKDFLRKGCGAKENGCDKGKEKNLFHVGLDIGGDKNTASFDSAKKTGL